MSVEVDDERREVVAQTRRELIRFTLRKRTGVEHRIADGRVRRRSVPVGEVARDCLREWEAEQLVLELSRRGERTLVRRGRWCQAGRRLAHQVHRAGRSRRIYILPFRVLLANLFGLRASKSPTRSARRSTARYARLASGEIRRLMSVPGVNVITAATFVAAIGDVSRFGSERRLVGYLGLDPRVRQSDPTRPSTDGSQSRARRQMLVASAANSQSPTLVLANRSHLQLPSN